MRSARHFSVATVWFLTLAPRYPSGVYGQRAPGTPEAQAPAAAALPEPMNWTAEQDHQNMMEQLGIRALRPGPSGDENAPNHANYDESKANPYPIYPVPVTLKNGMMVTSA